ncbi:hypothetical protein HY967_05190 [Candidatus Jorgensenbacteria bacterium]|nr:hypothetical protein [Candidatus Jorgensenbacteria bacterium]
MKKGREIFVLQETADLEFKLGMIIWLKRLADGSGLTFECNPQAIDLKRDGVSVLMCGVEEIGRSAVADFFSLFIDRNELKTNKVLARHLVLMECYHFVSVVPHDDADGRMWISFDPTLKRSAILLCGLFDEYWGEAIAEILGCTAERRNSLGGYVLYYSKQPIACMYRRDERINIEPFEPFIADGLLSRFYLLGKRLRYDRFVSLFRLKQEEVMGPEYDIDDD